MNLRRFWIGVTDMNSNGADAREQVAMMGPPQLAGKFPGSLGS
jgi:hypothetical protein